MKVVCIAYLHGFGGAEKQIIMLANGLAEIGHKVTLISVSDDKLCYKLNDNVIYIAKPDSVMTPFNIINRYKFLRNQLKRLRPDVTINYWYQSVYMTMLMRKSYTGKVIYSERGDPGDAEYTGVLGLLRRLTIHKVDGFVFQSEGARDYFDDSIKKKSLVIHNPIAIKKSDYEIPTERKKQIINVGRLHPQKNQHLLIAAFSKVESKLLDYSLEIYGDGELKEELTSLIDEKGLCERVHIHESTKQILEIINQSSLFVLSSDFEGMPNALMEAMALGVPCISTDCKPGGARTLIKNGENGYIVPRDDVNALSMMMLYVLNDNEKAKRIGNAAQDIINTHTPKYIYGLWDCFLHDVKGDKCDITKK